MKDWSVNELYFVPMYPQYAESSTRSALESAIKQARQAGFRGRIHALRDFFAEPEFIDSHVEQVTAEIRNFRPDHLLFSFHGLPEHHLSKLYPEHCHRQETCCESFGEHNRFCYRAQCFVTASAIRAKLDFPQEKTSVGFQSRLGRRPWIKPYTDHLVTELAGAGARRILVSSPSFVADCLETLEEVQMRLREQFLKEGGEDLKLVPALNAQDHWVERFARMIGRADLKWQNDVSDI
jgi:ferrochelatase